jgi:hypothetical protein
MCDFCKIFQNKYFKILENLDVWDLANDLLVNSITKSKFEKFHQNLNNLIHQKIPKYFIETYPRKIIENLLPIII